MKPNIKDKLQKINKDHYSLLVDIGKVAQEENQKVYLVGGIVRDILLGFENLDIDIVVENNAKLLAETLTKKFSNCELLAKHDKFHTAKLIFNLNGKKIPIDLASTRKEIYREPAALPDVEVTTLENDLRRRDFTINALAVSLMPKDFGDIADFFDGLEDLKTKKIRAVPNDERHGGNIFVEDPTRMIRAIRFACKLGFEIEEYTRELLNKAIDSGQFDNLIEKIRGDRVKIEIRYLFNLPNIEEAVKSFFESGVYRLISKGLRYTDEIKKTITKSKSFVQNSPHIEPSLKWLVYFAILVKDLCIDNPTVAEKTLTNLQMTGRELDTVVRGFYAFVELHAKILQAADSILAYNVLSKLYPESSLIVKALFVNSPNMVLLIDEYLERTSKIKLEITGQDLIFMGVSKGKSIGAILQKVLELKIKNPNMTKEDEVTEAKNLLKSIKL